MAEASAGETLRAETGLGESRDRLAAILGEVADGITVQDAAGVLVFANDAAARQLGFATAEELLATPLPEVAEQLDMRDDEGERFSPDRLPGRVAHRGEASAETTIRYRLRATGEERWASVRATPIFGVDGRVEAAVTVFHDVTERRRTEEHARFLAEAGEVLASSLDYQRTLAQVARLAVPRLGDWCMVYMRSEDGGIERLAVEHAGGLQRGVLEHLRDYPFDPDAAIGVPAVLRTGEPQLHKDADSALVAADVHDAERLAAELEPLGIRSWMCVPLALRDRTIGAISVLAAESRRCFDERDLALTEELARRAALAVENARLYAEARAAARESADSLALLDSVLASAPVGIGLWDTDLRYVRVNDALAEINGVPADEHVGRTLRDVVPDLAPAIEPIYRRVLETGEPYVHMEVTGETAASPGTVRYWLTSCYPVRDAEGDIVGAGAVVTEITERKRAELAVQASEQRLSFLAEVGELLAGSLDEREMVAGVARLAVPRLADSCAVWLADEGALVRVAEAHADGECEAAFASLPPRYDVHEDRGVELVQAFTARAPLLRRPGDSADGAVGAAMAVPLVTRAHTLGVVSLSSRAPGRYDETDLAFAQELARRVALAVDRARLYGEAHESLALLDTLLETAPVGLAFFDRDLRYVRVNDALAEINGVPAGEHVGRTMAEVLPQMDVRVADSLRHVLETGEPVLDSEVVGETPAQPGEKRYWSMSYYPVRDESGDVLGLGAVVVETSERRRGEEERGRLLESERRARAAAEAAQEQLAFLAEASRILATSLDLDETLQHVATLFVPQLAEFCAIWIPVGERIERVAGAFGVALHGVIPDRFASTYPLTPESPVPLVTAYLTGETQVLDELPPWLFDAVAHSEPERDAMEALGLRSALIVPLSAGGRVQGVMTCISTRPAAFGDAEVALAEEVARRAAVAIENARLYQAAEQRAHAAEALEFTGDAVVLLDANGVVLLWNPAAERIIGLAAEEVLGRRAEDAIPGWRELTSRVLLGSRPETLPLEFDARELWLSISGVAFAGGTVFAFRDVTEERAVEKMKSDFVSTVSHELRTPLAAIYGAALTLRREDTPLSEFQRADLLAVIATEAERLAGIVNDILWASRLESGTMHMAIASCDATAMARAVVQSARVHTPDSVSLELVAPEDLPPVAADPDKVRQVLGNLVENAIKYSPDGGRVELRLEPTGGALRFVVRDEGLGIPPHEQERIFEKFYRLDPNLTRGVGGTGLGLYISRELVHRMDGRIWVESREGEGSTFVVELPVT